MGGLVGLGTTVGLGIWVGTVVGRTDVGYGLAVGRMVGIVLCVGMRVGGIGRVG